MSSYEERLRNMRFCAKGMIACGVVLILLSLYNSGLAIGWGKIVGAGAILAGLWTWRAKPRRN